MTAYLIAGVVLILIVAAIVAVRAKRGHHNAIQFPSLPMLKWSDAECEASLQEVFEHARQDACGAVNWYAAARRPKRYVSTGARALALLGFGAAGFFPLLDQLLAQPLKSIWVTIAVAIAGAALAFDRFWGASSGWIRYMKSEQQLRDAIEGFELEWEAKRASWRGQPPSAEAVAAALAFVREFTTQANGIVQAETDSWVEEFKASMKQIDEAVHTRAAEEKARSEAERDGAVNIVVTNGAQCDTGWKISVDDGGDLLFSGTTAAVKLPPRIHKFRVRGRLKGAAADAEAVQAVEVPAGGVVDVKFTL